MSSTATSDCGGSNTSHQSATQVKQLGPATNRPLSLVRSDREEKQNSSRDTVFNTVFEENTYLGEILEALGTNLQKHKESYQIQNHSWVINTTGDSLRSCSSVGRFNIPQRNTFSFHIDKQQSSSPTLIPSFRSDNTRCLSHGQSICISRRPIIITAEAITTRTSAKV